MTSPAEFHPETPFYLTVNLGKQKCPHCGKDITLPDDNWITLTPLKIEADGTVVYCLPTEKESDYPDREWRP